MKNCAPFCAPIFKLFYSLFKLRYQYMYRAAKVVKNIFGNLYKIKKISKINFAVSKLPTNLAHAS